MWKRKKMNKQWVNSLSVMDGLFLVYTACTVRMSGLSDRHGDDI